MRTLQRLEENLMNNNEMLLVKGGAGEIGPTSHTEEDAPTTDDGT